MNTLVTFRIAIKALRRNKGRSLLTALGIIIGIVAVIAVVAVTQGASSMMREQINSMGSNLVMIFPGSMRTGGFHSGAGSQQTLTADDADAIARECRYVVAVSPVVRSGGQAVYRENDWSTSIHGADPSYPQVRSWNLEKGDFFTESDIRSGSRVCVIGGTVADQLFPAEDPVGKTIRIKNMPFRVLGVLTRKGSAAFGQDQDDTIIAPWTTVRRVLQNSPFNNVSQILVSLNSIDNLPMAKEDISGILRQRHRLSPGTDDDFTVTDMTEVTQMITKVSRVMTVLLTIVASISLIVGGIGIMNIMLVSVTERTREIGLRMAVGARRRDILLQFLVEAVGLAGVGGLLGVIIGVGVAYGVGYKTQWPVLISPIYAMGAVCFAGLVGIIFGLYPAWRAARLDPIESLRRE